MSRSELQRLVQDAHETPGLLEDLRSRIHDPAEAMEWARQRGYVLTQEDMNALAESDRELSDDELEEAAGGDDWSGGPGGTPPPPPVP